MTIKYPYQMPIDTYTEALEPEEFCYKLLETMHDISGELGVVGLNGDLPLWALGYLERIVTNLTIVAENYVPSQHAKKPRYERAGNVIEFPNRNKTLH